MLTPFAMNSPKPRKKHRWLPKLAGEAVTRSWVEAAVKAATANGAEPHAGKIMGALMKNHKGELDGKLAQALVKEVLAA
jgi:uncharacterized protein YqeY